MITKELQKRILEALQQSRKNFTGSNNKFSVSIGINPAQYSRIKNGDTEKVLSDAQWISLARRLGVSPTNTTDWKTANTPVFRFIATQLELCQTASTSAILCDLSDIGKTYTAVHYAKTHKNVVYVDCSQVKSKQKLVRYIAKEFGVGGTGRYSDVYENLVFYLKTLPTPLIILDEAGDLDYPAFLEVKALWNATELACGWYMMGADGLKEKIRRAIDDKKVGYAEIFSRFGKRYGKVVPISKEESEKMLQASAAMIIKANNPDLDVNKLLRSTMGEDNVPSLRRIYKELAKIEPLSSSVLLQERKENGNGI
jgi:DNA transposition AAA+ family ATPase